MIAKKIYSLSISTLRSDVLEKSLEESEDASLRIYKEESGFVLEGNAEGIGSRFRASSRRLLYKDVREGFIMKQSIGSPSKDLYDKLDTFKFESAAFLFKLAGPYLKKVAYEDIPKGTLAFGVDSQGAVVDPSADVDVYILKSSRDTFIGRTKDRLRISVDKLVATPSGFYTLTPRYSNVGVSAQHTPTGVDITSSQPVLLEASANILINGLLLSKLHLLPDNSYHAKIDMTSHTPLKSKQQLDPKKSHIIFKSDGDKRTPVCVFAPGASGIDEEMKKRLNSDPEHLKGYSFVANKVEILWEVDTKKGVIEVTNPEYLPDPTLPIYNILEA